MLFRGRRRAVDGLDWLQLSLRAVSHVCPPHTFGAACVPGSIAAWPCWQGLVDPHEHPKACVPSVHVSHLPSGSDDTASPFLFTGPGGPTRAQKAGRAARPRLGAGRRRGQRRRGAVHEGNGGCAVGRLCATRRGQQGRPGKGRACSWGCLCLVLLRLRPPRTAPASCGLSGHNPACPCPAQRPHSTLPLPLPQGQLGFASYRRKDLFREEDVSFVCGCVYNKEGHECACVSQAI